MKILIVDDSKAMRMIIQRTLKQCDIGSYTVVEASNGQEGLEQVRGCQPDLVLSDWNMPEMNGLEFLKAMREEGINTPFGFITTECTSDVKELARETGASFLITKPFTPEKFEAELKKFVAA